MAGKTLLFAVFGSPSVNPGIDFLWSGSLHWNIWQNSISVCLDDWFGIGVGVER